MNTRASNLVHTIAVVVPLFCLAVANTGFAQHQLWARWGDKELQQDELQYDFKPNQSVLVIGTAESDKQLFPAVFCSMIARESLTMFVYGPNLISSVIR